MPLPLIAKFLVALFWQRVDPFRGLRFMCCFQFKLWWMTQRMGTCGKDVPLETQFMLIERKGNKGEGGDSPTIYTVLVPLLEGQLRAVLQGNDKNEIEICLESDLIVPHLSLNSHIYSMKGEHDSEDSFITSQCIS